MAIELTVNRTTANTVADQTDVSLQQPSSQEAKTEALAQYCCCY